MIAKSIFVLGVRRLGCIGSFLLLPFLSGCTFVEERVSNHSFVINIQRNRYPTLDVVRRDIDAFARTRGFTPEPDAVVGIKSARLKSFRYFRIVSKPDKVLTLSGSYTTNATGLTVLLYGPAGVECQSSADRFYEDYKKHFSSKYGLLAVSDNLRTR